ncbi:MAG: TonB-dependent receptor [Cryomorphaceae bacterium]|nr:TonB-dependent receptor [Cryomorphaceae bacterium]MBT7383875.1 TonB-dependent receptor [Cryomorphaceae bacterium]
MIIGSASYSQSNIDTISNTKLEEVVVTATKTLRQLSTLPMPAKLITKEEIAKSSSTKLSDILDDQPGIFIVPDFGGGNGIQIQGLDSQYTLLLIDGSPIIGRQSGTLDLDRISIGNIEQIEIIKGSSSSLYGTDALGGVVNLITSKTKDSISAEASYKISTFNTNDISVNLGKISQNGDNLNFYFNSFDSNGYDLNDDPILNTVEPYKSYTGFLRHNFKKNKWSYFSSVRIYNENQNFTLNENSYGKNIINELGINTSINYIKNKNYKLIFENYYTNYKNDEEFRLNQNSIEESFFNQSLFKSELRSIYTINKKNTLTFGLGFYSELLKRNNFYREEVSQNSFNYFVQYEGFIFENTNYVFGARYDQYDEYESEFSPRFAIRTQINDNISSKISIGKGFKTPDYRQLYFNFSNSISGYSVIGFNAAKEIISNLQSLGQISNLIISQDEFEGKLKPETSISFNLGFNIKTNKSTVFDINFFRNQISNLIDYKIIASKVNGQSIFSYYNLNKVYTQGIEFNSTSTVFNDIEISLGYQFLEAKDNDSKNQIKNGEVFARRTPSSPTFQIKPKDYFGLYNRSKHNFNLKISYAFKDYFDIYFKSKYRSKYGLSDSNGNNLLDDFDDFVESNLISDISISKNYKNYILTFGVENLFDYTDRENIPNYPGRIIYSKLNITL